MSLFLFEKNVLMKFNTFIFNALCVCVCVFIASCTCSGEELFVVGWECWKIRWPVISGQEVDLGASWNFQAVQHFCLSLCDLQIYWNRHFCYVLPHIPTCIMKLLPVESLTNSNNYLRHVKNWFGNPETLTIPKIHTALNLLGVL